MKCGSISMSIGGHPPWNFVTLFFLLVKVRVLTGVFVLRFGHRRGLVRLVQRSRTRVNWIILPLIYLFPIFPQPSKSEYKRQFIWCSQALHLLVHLHVYHLILHNFGPCPPEANPVQRIYGMIQLLRLMCRNLWSVMLVKWTNPTKLQVPGMAEISYRLDVEIVLNFFLVLDQSLMSCALYHLLIIKAVLSGRNCVIGECYGWVIIQVKAISA